MKYRIFCAVVALLAMVAIMPADAGLFGGGGLFGLRADSSCSGSGFSRREARRASRARAEYASCSSSAMRAEYSACSSGAMRSEYSACSSGVYPMQPIYSPPPVPTQLPAPVEINYQPTVQKTTVRISRAADPAPTPQE